jgi:hypothetical protein
MIDYTEPLQNGAELPAYPASSTSKTITKYGKVTDAKDGTVLRVGLHRNEIEMLMAGNQMALTHLYAYGIFNNRVFHTRPLVIIQVECEELDG